jgi:quercetin dioxygenase-like cupin family protein
MRYLLAASCLVGALGLAQLATAQGEGPPVPVEKASYHWPVFSNEHVMVLRVIFPPGRGSNYHTHSLDQISVLVEAAANEGQELGKPPTPARPGTRGNISFTDYSKKSFTHKSTNTATTPFHNVVIALLKPQPGNYAPAAREGYTELFNNARARAWRLTLEPGQSAPAISQKAPGIRVVIDGGEITEIVPGETGRAQALRMGDFYWQDAGVTRAIRNTGSTKIEIAEFELK